MDLGALNKVANNTFLSTRKLSELEKEKKYLITTLRIVRTRFGKKVVLTINNEFQVFMTDRVSKLLAENEKMFEEMLLNAKNCTLFIVYHGYGKFEFVHDEL